MKTLRIKCPRCKVESIYAVSDEAKATFLKRYPKHPRHKPLSRVCTTCQTPAPIVEARKLLS